MVKFSSEVDTLTMFGDMAVAIVRLMGASGTVPGALAPEDVPAALERLKRAVDAGAPMPRAESAEAGEDDEQPRVSLNQRAWPVLQMLERAAQRKSYVMWEEEKPAFGGR